MSLLQRAEHRGIACYRIEHDHWTNQQALTESKSFGMSSMEIAMQRFILHFIVPSATRNTAATSVLTSPAFPLP